MPALIGVAVGLLVFHRVDAFLLIAALALPLVVLTRVGVNWCSGPEEYGMPVPVLRVISATR